MDKHSGICRAVLWASVVICMLGTLSGCTRRFYRKQADREVDAVLCEKDVFPAWKIEQMHVYPDMRARFSDPSNPDRPPMPPDDPAAHYLGPNPQRPPHRAGVARVEGTGYLDLLAEWDAVNRTEREARRGAKFGALSLPGPQKLSPAFAVHSPLVRARFGDLKPGTVTTVRGASDDKDAMRLVMHQPKDAQPEQLPLLKAIKDAQPELVPLPKLIEPEPTTKPAPYLIRIEQAMELALINSREFQTRREDLYLAALPVTRERFAFGPQVFAIEQIIRERTGASFPEGAGDRWQFASTVGLSKLFSTGALLLVGFANQTVLELNNPAVPRLTSTSGINLDFIQPLLRGGGRAATLEPLTQVERNLLYEIRDYARFRKLYFQYVIGGGTLSPIGITTAGNLAAFHPVPAALSGQNPARPQISPSASGALFLGINAVAPAEGYLPSILKASIYQNEVANLERLNVITKLFKAYESGGIISNLQVGQVELQRLQSESLVLLRQQELRDSLDNFKQQLGVPVNTPLELDDQVIRPITDLLSRYDAMRTDYEATIAELNKLDNPDSADRIRAELARLYRESAVARETVQFRKSIPLRFQRWGEFKDIKSILDKLEKDSTARRELEKREEKLSIEERRQLRDLKLEIALGMLELAVRRYESRPWAKLASDVARREEHSARWRDVRNAFILILAEASNERFVILRASWAPVPRVIVDGIDLIDSDVENAYDVVTRSALENRVDLMNTRAQVVDAWRQLRVFANSLLGTFNVAYHMDSSTPPGEAKPLAFQTSRTRHQLGMNFELPLVRLTERNAYRASLIAYQRARRNLDQHEDEIVNQVRSEIRQLQVLAKNLKIQQQAVELAYQQLESSLETFRAPQTPNQGGNPDANAFSLTQQLLQAYRGLPQAQNQLLATWINYHIVRQQLYLDLELMPLDARGVWIDEFSNQPSGRPEGLEPQQQPPEQAGGAAPRNPARFVP